MSQDNSGTGRSTVSGGDVNAADLRQALLSMETAIRMLGKAVHRFSELRTVHNELRYDVEWTNFEVQLSQALGNVKEIVGRL